MATPQYPASLPLPARIFHAAMQRRVPLDSYAATLALPGDTLQRMLSGQEDQLSPEVVGTLAAAHGQEAGARLGPPAPAEAEPFGAWLERQMEGIPQASLRTRAQLEGRLLRAFLSGKSLPDADQAERLARALYVDGAEMARVIVADMSRRSGQPPAAAARGGAAAGSGATSDRAPAARAAAQPDAPAPAPARRRRRPAEAAAMAAEPPPAHEAGPAEAAGPSPAAVADAAEGAEITAVKPRAPRRSARARAAASAAPVEGSAPLAEPPAEDERAGPPAEAEAPVGLSDSLDADTPDLTAEAPAQPAPGARKRPSERAAAPPVAAVVTAPAAALELSPDEARLVHSYRRLHPHGRRATLQYIGSLLVEE